MPRYPVYLVFYLFCRVTKTPSRKKIVLEIGSITFKISSVCILFVVCVRLYPQSRTPLVSHVSWPTVSMALYLFTTSGSTENRAWATYLQGLYVLTVWPLVKAVFWFVFFVCLFFLFTTDIFIYFSNTSLTSWIETNPHNLWDYIHQQSERAYLAVILLVQYICFNCEQFIGYKIHHLMDVFFQRFEIGVLLYEWINEAYVWVWQEFFGLCNYLWKIFGNQYCFISQNCCMSGDTPLLLSCQSHISYI